MNRKKHVISSFLKFITEKYSQDEPENEVESPDSKDDVKNDSSVKTDDEVPTENALKEDLLDIIQEYKKRYEK